MMVFIGSDCPSPCLIFFAVQSNLPLDSNPTDAIHLRPPCHPLPRLQRVHVGASRPRHRLMAPSNPSLNQILKGPASALVKPPTRLRLRSVSDLSSPPARPEELRRCALKNYRRLSNTTSVLNIRRFCNSTEGVANTVFILFLTKAGIVPLLTFLD